MYSICLPKILGISYCSLLVQKINITSTPRIKSIVLENKTKNPNKQTYSLIYDLLK